MSDTASWLPQGAGASSRNLVLAIMPKTVHTSLMTLDSFKNRDLIFASLVVFFLQSRSEFMYEFRSQKHNTMPSLSSLREVVQRVHQNHNITSRQKNLQKKEKKGLTATAATKKKANDIPPVKIREREDWLAAG